nr:hypothetical protein [Petrachloros mirabilis]
MKPIKGLHSLSLRFQNRLPMAVRFCGKMMDIGKTTVNQPIDCF